MSERRIGDGAYSVLVIDMFHHDEESETIVRGFPTAELAAEYARRRTRDSLEALRKPAQSKSKLREAWYSFGEDCSVIGGSYKGSSEIDFFIKHPATAEERDWMAVEKSIQPR